MKVEQVKLDGTAVEFYNNYIKEIDYKYFENMVSIVLSKLVIRA